MSQTSSFKVVWFSRILRWVLGITFMVTGLLYYAEGGWPAILFGAAFFTSGFFRPRQCLHETCGLPVTAPPVKENNTQTKQ